MSEAIYGLIGALGGAFLGAAATLIAPALTGRHVRRQEQRARSEAEFERMNGARRQTLEQRADGHYEEAENARRRLLGVLMDRMEELREEMART
ncbi:hypothetical protein [Streptomyces tendae]|uniref:hypothetical protein n=1 Tax=Streptomyces tendae TaxID=1932 RepID=UPI0036CBC17B